MRSSHTYIGDSSSTIGVSDYSSSSGMRFRPNFAFLAAAVRPCAPLCVSRPLTYVLHTPFSIFTHAQSAACTAYRASNSTVPLPRLNVKEKQMRVTR